MPTTPPVEHYHSGRCAGLTQDSPIQSGEPQLTSLQEIINQRKLNALFQPILDLQQGIFFGFEGLIRGPADSTLHAPLNLFGAAEKVKGHSLFIEQRNARDAPAASKNNKYNQ